MSGWKSTQAETKAINNLLPTGHNPTSTEREGNKTHCRMVADLQKLIEASEAWNDWCGCSVRACVFVCVYFSVCLDAFYNSFLYMLVQIVLWS